MRALYQSEGDILQLVNAFLSQTLPKAQWDSRTHLTVGSLLGCTGPLDPVGQILGCPPQDECFLKK